MIQFLIDYRKLLEVHGFSKARIHELMKKQIHDIFHSEEEARRKANQSYPDSQIDKVECLGN